MTSFTQITVGQLPEGAAILDVREDDEWAAGHIEGATHIPLTEVPQRLAEVPEADAIYVVCRAGGRSARAAEFLVANGFEAINVDGGMQSWAALGKPMVADGNGAPEVI